MIPVQFENLAQRPQLSWVIHAHPHFAIVGIIKTQDAPRESRPDLDFARIEILRDDIDILEILLIIGSEI